MSGNTMVLYYMSGNTMVLYYMSVNTGVIQWCLVTLWRYTIGLVTLSGNSMTFTMCAP